VLVAVSVIAAVLTTGSFLPQARRTLRTRSADDFAWGYLGMLGTGIFLWCLYGALSGEPVLFLANVVTLGFVVLIARVKQVG
jgi:MtN3 and saliva related transmembrane protein